MNRVTMTCLVLAMTGGCMTDPDLIDENSYTSPRRAQTQAPAWSYPPQNATLAGKYTKELAPAAAAKAPKPSAPRPTDTKPENTIVRTGYTLNKDVHDTGTPKSIRKEERPAELELSLVNLGMLCLTNSKRITFRYEIKDAASIGASSLEIWGTTDMRTWKKFDTKPRSPSSLSVEIKDEGLYGFSMIARGKDAVRSQTEPGKEEKPPSDEPPQVWVAVDATKPVVQLLGAEVKTQRPATGATLVPPPSLVVRWSAKDRNIGPRPITLLYAERPEGPWRPLAANLENNGRYEGPLPPSSSATLYVRVQAVDLMGNLGMAQSTSLHLPSQSSARATHPAVSILAVEGE